jgi:3-phenylpropionate/cinnamic acid dioxygenase small subunit
MQLEAVVRRLELEQLYTDYVHCLDTDELEHWPDFFTEDCFYRVTSAENYEAGMPLGLIHATSRNMLKDRVSALRKANIYEPQRYRHLVSSIKIVEAPRRTRSHGEFYGRADDARRRHDPLCRRALRRSGQAPG